MSFSIDVFQNDPTKNPLIVFDAKLILLNVLDGLFGGADYNKVNLMIYVLADIYMLNKI